MVESSEDLARARAQHAPREQVADPERQLQPALVPAADHPRRPPLGDGGHALDRRLRRATQGVPVEVDEPRLEAQIGRGTSRGIRGIEGCRIEIDTGRRVHARRIVVDRLTIVPTEVARARW